MCKYFDDGFGISNCKCFSSFRMMMALDRIAKIALFTRGLHWGIVLDAHLDRAWS